jgi:hypothetical protein
MLLERECKETMNLKRTVEVRPPRHTGTAVQHAWANWLFYHHFQFSQDRLSTVVLIFKIDNVCMVPLAAFTLILCFGSPCQCCNRICALGCKEATSSPFNGAKIPFFFASQILCWFFNPDTLDSHWQILIFHSALEPVLGNGIVISLLRALSTSSSILTHLTQINTSHLALATFSARKPFESGPFQLAGLG